MSKRMNTIRLLVALLTVAALLVATVPVVAEPGRAPRAANGSITYMIKPGDTLYSIAWRHGVDMQELARVNAIQNVSLIYVGRLLTIPSSHPAIRITSPQPGSAISSPVTVSGESDTFEGHVAVRVRDANWRVIGEGVGIGGGFGTYAPFSVAVSFTETDAQWGVVEAWWNRPQDGAEVDTVSVSVRLSGEPPAGRSYTVVRGDNLYRIGLRFGTTVQALVQANNIADADLIYVGQVLQIP
jgi:LysM repeat protein